MHSKDRAVILFDGACNFCNASVQFILKRDPNGCFQFASQQGDAGRQLMDRYEVPSSINSIVLIKNNQAYYKSDAALQICKQLSGAWRMCAWLLVIPRPVRNLFYDVLARNRYKWFGKSESCMLPKPEFRSRFLE
ncbi:thiol-disulfide oxidoreductase DCC family protein [Xylanibacillus composti]|uniref:Thiol-disulfide oxidoreductase DCC family protein n=1 Tax=Xylanibacillus composti TaxID=1572762 RepID=A0A8J4H656_9BACL|nr:thiol-disulfide oxidoreductase DCC family protein [Xylanibacillus composti]MDT9725251.1 thiol-disulfide oxidoreductase DCC family protein [Xylanibacillus composti]GIQ70451.1 hypothetical protein XYCOK13_32750 [Xylanibacillus composti]